MKPLFSLIFSIVFLFFLSACGGGSTSDSTPPEDTTPPGDIIIPDNPTPDEPTLDNTPPVITILGNNPETVTQDETYTDSGATALDETDGSVQVITTGSVNTAIVGSYTITYTATDKAGNEASETRTVNVTSSIIDNNLTLDDFEDAVPHNTSFTSTHFSGSQNCAQCHDGISDTSNGKDVSLVKAWKGTMMGNAAIDPLYLAKVASEVKRNPEFKEVIEAKCSRCHMPMAHVEAGFSGDATAMFDDGFLNPENPHYDAAKDGVSCTLCHQIEDTPQLGTDEGFSGAFVIAEKSGSDRAAYGPYGNPRTGPMINNVQFTPKESSHMTQSKLCASCHNLDTPVINAQGGSLSGATFPEQSVYTEWEFSDFNTTKSCQDCHMPQTEGSVVISTRPNNLSARPSFNQHQFIGANTYMLEILKNNRTKLGAVADTAIFDESISNTREFLKAAADVTIGSKSVTNGTLTFSVLVRNHSGHKFPTSLPSRRAWLHVKVTNAANQTLFESGAMNSEGQVIGVDDNTDGYEEHYEKIDDTSEVQVYEPIMADTDGHMTYTFMQASRYLKDNRILPLGFKSNAPANAQPYGEAVDDNDFVGGSDTVRYEVNNLPNDDYTISVTLHYQTASYGFMQDLYSDINLTEVALMKVLDDNTMNHYETISIDTATITIP